MPKNFRVRVSKRGKKSHIQHFQIGKMIVGVESIANGGLCVVESRFTTKVANLTVVYFYHQFICQMITTTTVLQTAKQAIHDFYKQLCSTTRCILVKKFQLHFKIATKCFWLQLKHFCEAMKAAGS